ncbi:MAG: hypothetical protein OXM55_06785 [Bdellovibrionales bacterium]|nr:hypothetical protein [Bdellovibrionales bacterium]
MKSPKSLIQHIGACSILPQSRHPRKNGDRTLWVQEPNSLLTPYSPLKRVTFFFKGLVLSFLFLILSANASVKANNLRFSPSTYNSLSTQNKYIEKISLNKKESPSLLLAKKNYYIKAANYFKQRKRPLHHFLDLGIGGVLIESFYPFKTTSYPFFAYINYRKEKWGQTKIPIIFSFQYESLLNQKSHSRIHALGGLRYPTSHDLTLFHVDFMVGTSVPVLFKIEEIALELRLLFTHIIGPKAATKRLYFQWGAKTTLKDQFQYGLIVQLGLDMHL